MKMSEKGAKKEKEETSSSIQFVVITGQSGAGKSEAIRCFEDMGYFCVDNLPPTLISRMSELCLIPGSNIKKVALVIDVRGGGFFNDLQQELKNLEESGVPYSILFLQASDEILFNRFKETRRRHPLVPEGSISDGIKEEGRLLEAVKSNADIVMDTSEISANDLRDQIRTYFLGLEKQKTLFVTAVSFGYKYGAPVEADLIIDVRFLPNPYYIDELKDFNGKDKQIRDFVLKRKETKEFVKKFFDLLSFVLPYYVKEGKSYLTIALGCTGGTHRSVTLTEETGNFLKKKGYKVTIRHRDLGKDFQAK